jgi:hypothetical protein
MFRSSKNYMKFLSFDKLSEPLFILQRQNHDISTHDTGQHEIKFYHDIHICFVIIQVTVSII